MYSSDQVANQEFDQSKTAARVEIVGGGGTTGAGATDAGTARVVAASDSPDVAALNSLVTANHTDLTAINTKLGNVGVTSLPALPAGGNAIGTVGVTSLPALPAGTNAIGSVTADPTAATALSNNQVAIGTTATTIVAADASCKTLFIQNQSASVNLFIGGAGVTTATGMLLTPNQIFQVPAQLAKVAWFGVAASAITAGYLKGV